MRKLSKYERERKNEDDIKKNANLLQSETAMIRADNDLNWGTHACCDDL